jgi:hypothetical protein
MAILSSKPDTQSLVSRLDHFRLRRDDSGPFRVYRDSHQRIYFSVTYVLGQTQDRSKLIAWLASGGKFAVTKKEVAATRGTRTHNAGEYILKTARKLASNSANRRGLWKETASGLWRCPSHLTKWALEKAATSAPDPGFSARGYTESLTAWILEHVTAIYLIETSVCCWVKSAQRGFAGTFDALLEIDGIGPQIVDWKTCEHKDPAKSAPTHFPQLGAYSIALQNMVGLEALGGSVVLVPRLGLTVATPLDIEQLKTARADFMARFLTFSQSLDQCTPPPSQS